MSSNSYLGNLFSSYCFLFEKCERKPASSGSSGHVHRELVPCWRMPWSHYWKQFFRTSDAKFNPTLHHESKEILSKTTLEMKSNKHARNMTYAVVTLKNDLLYTRVATKSLKQKVRTSVKPCIKKCPHIFQIYEYVTPELAKKGAQKHTPHKSRNIRKMTPGCVRVTPILRVAQPAFAH